MCPDHAAEVSRQRRLRPALLVLLLLALLAWGWLDVRARAVMDPADPLGHRTDVTVYTEAGLAFFDGRPPYEVTNPRGWHYLYPPLFALLMAPLGNLPSEYQAMVWFLISLGLAWGMIVEGQRLAAWFVVFGGAGVPSARFFRALPALALLIVLPPLLNCLQRGQVGIAVVYCLMLGIRLMLTGGTVWSRFLGGVVLSLSVAIKLTPLLPVGVLLLHEAMTAFRRPAVHLGQQLASVPACWGGAAGLALFFFLFPALLLGWSTNLRHLQTWLGRVALNENVAEENDFNAQSMRNQCLANAIYRFGNCMGRLYFRKPEDRYVGASFYRDRQKPMPMDKPWGVAIIQASLGCVGLAFLAALWRAARSGDAVASAAAVGLACVMTLVVSPVSWGHHFIILMPGVLLTVPWVCRRWGVGAGVAIVAVPLLLVWTHYLALPWAGRRGVLGIGTALWLLACSVAMLVGARRRHACLRRFGQDPAPPASAEGPRRESAVGPVDAVAAAPRAA